MVTRLTIAALAAALIVVGDTTPARAGLVISALGATAPPGGSSTFDVTLTNTGPNSVDLGGFQLELSVASGSGVQFTDVTTDTAATYVFAAAPGPPPFSFGTFPNTDFLASDSYFALPGYQTIGAGETLGLAHVRSRSIPARRPARSPSRSSPTTPTPAAGRCSPAASARHSTAPASTARST